MNDRLTWQIAVFVAFIIATALVCVLSVGMYGAAG